MAKNFKIGDSVVIPWGLARVHGTVAEVYGSGGGHRVVVALTPELSGYVVDEPTTVTFPADAIEAVVTA